MLFCMSTISDYSVDLTSFAETDSGSKNIRKIFFSAWADYKLDSTSLEIKLLKNESLFDPPGHLAFSILESGEVEKDHFWGNVIFPDEENLSPDDFIAIHLIYSEQHFSNLLHLLKSGGEIILSIELDSDRVKKNHSFTQKIFEIDSSNIWDIKSISFTAKGIDCSNLETTENPKKWNNRFFK